MKILLVAMILTTPLFHEKMRENINEQMCREPQPKGRPAVYYEKEKGRCVAKVRP